MMVHGEAAGAKTLSGNFVNREGNSKKSVVRRARCVRFRGVLVGQLGKRKLEEKSR